MKRFIITLLGCMIFFSIILIGVENANAQLLDRQLWVDTYKYNPLTRTQALVSSSVSVDNMDGCDDGSLKGVTGSYNKTANSTGCYNIRVDSNCVGCGSSWSNVSCSYRVGACSNCVKSANNSVMSVTYYK